MAKAKDFYGKDIAEVIEQACKALGASREELDIEVLETGSAGIFGLCKKKAHIRVQRKAVALAEEIEATSPPADPVEKTDSIEKMAPAEGTASVEKAALLVAVSGCTPQKNVLASAEEKIQDREGVDEEEQANEPEELEEEIPIEPPSAESLDAIQADLHRLLTLMGLPSEVQVSFEEQTVQCNITGPHEAHIVGSEGRTLDSLQYLLRKMVSRHLPDRIMLALNAGDFRERRAEELKVRAVELAELVKADGKTQAIPALNPSERRVVHMVLQEDKGVRSRSVGEGLFKKVLIYKPGKGRRPVSKKKRGGQSGRPSGD
ncbi:Jag N-terminal domain-containing protein [uncultured Desulfobulbus sp.]|uniref:Jag family protein n=1 Tax=uncultured Desulfobulbus sp. TaxID=239745 RepID=UPI0029C7F1EE|nr:Jag N-terminal domain-containing protein [uncultured Desulfobulbus sp.]